MTFIDTHAHLDVEQFDADRSQAVARAVAAGVEITLCPGITAASSEACVRLADVHETLYAGIGIQPNCCAEAAPGDWDRVLALVDAPKVVAVGETGLDRHWDFTPMEVQQDYFDRHLRLSQQHDLPVIVHCREAKPDVLAMLREAVARGPLRGVLHAFSGDVSFVEACLELGLHVSLAGPVTYTNKKFETLREAARSIPDDRILIETDSPYLTPHPLRGKQRRNEPALIIHTARCLAELRGVSLEEFAQQSTANARRLFGWE